MPRVGAMPPVRHAPRIQPVRGLRPGTPFRLPDWAAGSPGYVPLAGVFVEMAGDDAKVFVGERGVYWSGMTLVLPTGEPGAVPLPAAAAPKPSGPSRAARREQQAIVEHAVAVERAAPRQPAPIVQTAFGEEC